MRRSERQGPFYGLMVNDEERAMIRRAVGRMYHEMSVSGFPDRTMIRDDDFDVLKRLARRFGFVKSQPRLKRG